MNNEKTPSKTNAELDEIEAIFAEVEDVFGDLSPDGDDAETSSSAMDQLESVLAGTEFASETAESTGQLTLLQIADGETEGIEMQEGWLGDLWGKTKKAARKIAKSNASKILKRVVKLVKKSAKYKSCIPSVVVAVASFKAGKYGTCLKQAWSAFNCIKAKS